MAVRWATFNTVGALGFVLQLGILVGLTEYVHLHYLAGASIAVEAAILHNFFWHDRWTWRAHTSGKPHERWKRLARFNLVSIALSMTGQLLFTSLYVEILGVHYLSASIWAIASCSLLNFVVNDRVVFVPHCNRQHAESVLRMVS